MLLGDPRNLVEYIVYPNTVSKDVLNPQHSSNSCCVEPLALNIKKSELNNTHVLLKLVYLGTIHKGRL